MSSSYETHDSWQAFRRITLSEFHKLVNELSSETWVRSSLMALTPNEVHELLFRSLYYDFIGDSFRSSLQPKRTRISNYGKFARFFGFLARTTKEHPPAQDVGSHDGVLSIGFFHRHNNFRKEVSKHMNVHEFDARTAVYSPTFPEISRILQRVRLPRTSLQLARLLSVSEILATRPTWPSAILMSGHGIYSGESGALARIFLAHAKIRGSLLLTLQPGLVHGFASYLDQVEYEGQISDVYLAWGDTEVRMTARKLDFGSLYASRNLDAECKPGRQLVLPQVPGNSSSRPISFYWGMTRREFRDQMPSLLSMCRDFPNPEKTILRCKSPDMPFYSNWAWLPHAQTPSFDSGDVNTSGRISTYEENWITYPSTALVELNPVSEIHLRLVPAVGSFYPEVGNLVNRVWDSSRSADSRHLARALLAPVRRIGAVEGTHRLIACLREFGLGNLHNV